MINQRICEISCNEEEFLKAKPTYESALKSSDYEYDMKYKKYQAKTRTRRRNVIYFNPPYSANVKTNIGKEFLRLVKKHFPPNHKFCSLFNRNNLKISYSCMPNIKNILQGHNSRVLNTTEAPAKLCNCRKKDACPLKGNCLVSCVVYKAEVNSDEEKRVYYGSCSSTFKERYSNHKMSFSSEKHKEATKLSKYIWELNSKNMQYEIAWSIVKKCSPYRPSAKRCDLCLTEKLEIIRAKDDHVLNKRSEIANKCRHANKFSLSNILKRRLKLPHYHL